MTPVSGKLLQLINRDLDQNWSIPNFQICRKQQVFKNRRYRYRGTRSETSKSVVKFVTVADNDVTLCSEIFCEVMCQFSVRGAYDTARCHLFFCLSLESTTSMTNYLGFLLYS